MSETEPYKELPLLLGNAPQLDNRRVWYDPRKQNLNTHIMGLPGKGKSRFMQTMIEQDIENGRGLCLIDPHGSLVRAVLEYLYEEPDLVEDRRIIVLDPTDSQWTFGFNPFVKDLGKHTTPAYYVDTLIKAIQGVFGNDSAYTNPTILSHLRAVFYVLMTNQLSLAEAQEFVKPKEQAEVRLALTAPGVIDDTLVQSMWDRLNTLSDKDYYHEFVGPYNRIMSILFPPQLRRIFSSDRHLDFKELMDEGAIVLVNMNSSSSNSSPIGDPEEEMFASLLINEIYQEAKRRDDRDPNLRPFTLYIDECHRYLKSDIEKMIAELRKFKTSLVVAHQWLTQIKDEDLREGIINGFQNKVIFKLGNKKDCIRWADELFDYDPFEVEQYTLEAVGQEIVELEGETYSYSSASANAKSSAESTTKAKTEAEGKTHARSKAEGRSTGSSWGEADMGSSGGAVIVGPLGTSDYETMTGGSSWGSSSGFSESSSTMSGYVDATSVIQAIAEASGHISGESSSSSRSKSKTRSKTQTLKTIYRKVPKSYLSIEKQILLRAQEIKNLPIAHAVLRVADAAPILLKVINVPDVDVPREELEQFIYSLKEREDILMLIEEASFAGIDIEEEDADYIVYEEEEKEDE